MTPHRIQRKRTKGWRMPAGAVYVGRPSPFANRWRIHKMTQHSFPTYWMVQGDGRNFYPSSERVAVRFAVWMFRRWLGELPDTKLRLAVAMFRGKDLACWCPLDQPCHADVLLKIANQ